MLNDGNSTRDFKAMPAVRWLSIVGFAYLLTACQTTEPGIRVVTVPTPTPVACVNEADIPPEPEQVGDQFTGDARHDLGILAPNALALRVWGRTLRALIVPGCTVASE